MNKSMKVVLAVRDIERFKLKCIERPSVGRAKYSVGNICAQRNFLLNLINY